MAAAPPASRRGYLDWLRGLAVLIMIEAHLIDSWTRSPDREAQAFQWSMTVGGFGAPLFLFLAGVSVAMSAASKARKSGDEHAASNAVVRRGLEIFALAFLFRLQACLLSWGAWWTLLKVDILNIMGPSIMAAAALWGAVRTSGARLAAFAMATVAVALLTPVIRALPIESLPDPIEAYIRPLPGRTNFALFPWAGFVLAGGIAGELVFAAQRPSQERRLQLGLLISGLAGIGIAYAASFRPAIYPVANFWTSSPTFFFIRLGMCTAMVPIARGVDHFHLFLRRRYAIGAGTTDVPGRVVATLGRSSLFVYWIHVEMAYGAIAMPLKRALPLELSLLATVALCALLYQIVLWKDRRMRDIELTGGWRILAPVLK